MILTDEKLFNDMIFILPADNVHGTRVLIIIINNNFFDLEGI